MKCGVVNFADGQYKWGQIRLKDSLIKLGFPEKDIHLFQNIKQLNDRGIQTPSHKAVPYGFKLSCIEYMRRLGYEKILWLDASVWVHKPLDVIWKWMDDHDGFYVQLQGSNLNHWCNDNGLRLLNITRPEAKKIMIWQGGICGLDLTNKNAFRFFRLWLLMARNGAFKGSWGPGDGAKGGHRHDQSIGSGILYKMYKDRYNDIVCNGKQPITQYIGGVYGKIKETTILCVRRAEEIYGDSRKDLWYSDE